MKIKIICDCELCFTVVYVLCFSLQEILGGRDKAQINFTLPTELDYCFSYRL